MITEAQLRQIIPQNKYVEYWHRALVQLFPDYDINTPKRMAAFLAQCAHESGGFTVLVENLNYKPQALRRLFPKYFPDDVTANQYCARPNKQEAIANRIYANRMGNGPESSGDGYAFRGHGLIQLTGRDTWQAFADSIETPLTDLKEYMQTFEGACQSACWYWESRGLNKWADTGDIKELTRRINGGYIGLEDRIKHYDHAFHILGA